MVNNKWASLLWKINVMLLAVTGFAQMPLFTRYYMTSVPGFSWLGNFELTHSLHYIAAAVFLLQLCYWVGNTVFATGWILTPTGRWRALALAVLTVTGLARMAKNDPDLWLSPVAVVTMDWTHLAVAILFGGLTWIAHRQSQPYVRWKMSG